MKVRSAAPLLGLALAACSTTTGGTPATTAPLPSSASSPAAFDACTAFDDATVQGFRGVPDTKRPYTSGGADGEQGCRWDSADRSPAGSSSLYTVVVGRTTRTVDDYLANTTFTTTESTLAGRRVVNFASAGDDNACNLAVEIPGGSAVVVISPGFASVTRDQACADATAAAEVIAPTLPA